MVGQDKFKVFFCHQSLFYPFLFWFTMFEMFWYNKVYVSTIHSSQFLLCHSTVLERNGIKNKGSL